MKKPLYAVLVLLLLAVPASSVWADDYSDTVAVFKGAGQSGLFFDNSYGYAVFPTIGKAGIGVGGAHGKGRVYVNGKHVGNTAMTQLTLGLQLGAEAHSQIIFFEDERAFREFTSGNFEFGAQASAVAITAGASAGLDPAFRKPGSGSSARHRLLDLGRLAGFRRRVRDRFRPRSLP